MRIFIVVAISLLSFACSGGYVEGVSQKTEKGFLKFVGNVAAVSVSIDGKDPIVLSEDEDKDVVYEVKPGSHQIRAFRNNRIILDRVVYVDNSTTMEVSIP